VKPTRLGPEGGAYFEGAVEDITAVTRTQERLRTLETAIWNMDLGLLLSDLGGRILYANPAAANIHGYAVEELIGKESKVLGPESQRHERTQGTSVSTGVYRREGLNRRAGGTLFPVFLTSLPVSAPDGSPFCFITTCQDLSEAKRRDAQLQAALRDAQVGKLAAVVAHQVNTPLAAMKTRLEMLREDAGEDGASRGSLDSIMKQVDRVAQTVRALLGYVRQRNLGEEFTSIQGVVASVARLFEGAFQSNGILYDIDQPEEAVRVQGNAADLQEVFLNLFENYREMLGKGKRVSVSVRPSGDSVEVRLEDDGPGLGPDPERVFEPFYTTKAHGTGLGLPICRNILTAFGGTLVAENRSPEEGGGARFVVALPIAPKGAPSKEAP
jgi:PAS domain S-box-containing protein